MDEQTEEQQRLRLLRAIYDKTGEDENLHVNIFDRASAIGMTDGDEVEPIRQHLVAEGLLVYASPHGGIHITQSGIEVAKEVPRSFSQP